MGFFDPTRVLKPVILIGLLWLVCFGFHYWQDQGTISDLEFQKKLAQQKYDKSVQDTSALPHAGILDTVPDPNDKNLLAIEDLNQAILATRRDALDPLWFLGPLKPTGNLDL